MKTVKHLQEQLEQKNREELLHFALSQYEVYNDLISGYETAHKLLMNSGVCLTDILISLQVHLPKDTREKARLKTSLMDFFKTLNENETIRQYNNFYSNGRH